MAISGIDASGGGGTQDQIYSILCDCWGGPRDADVYQDHGSDPVTVANELGEELHDAAWATPQNAPSGYGGAVSATPSEDANRPETTPTEYRQQVTVYLRRFYTP